MAQSPFAICFLQVQLKGVNFSLCTISSFRDGYLKTIACPSNTIALAPATLEELMHNYMPRFAVHVQVSTLPFSGVLMYPQRENKRVAVLAIRISLFYNVSLLYCTLFYMPAIASRDHLIFCSTRG